MQIRQLLFLAAAMTTIVACGTNELQDDTALKAGDEINRINAVQEGESKTSISEDGISVLWNPQDEINVFYGSSGVKFTSASTQPEATTIFTSSQSLIFGGMEGATQKYIWGVYPYSAENTSDGSKVSVEVPAEQTAKAGTFAPKSFPCIGRSLNTDMAFYNLCGGVRFSVTKTGIKKAILSGNNGEFLAGRVYVAYDESGRPAVVDTVKTSKTITITAPNNGEFETGKWYYISALPKTLAGGFNLEFYRVTDKNEKGSLNSKNSVSIQRSRFGSIAEADKDVVFEEYKPATTPFLDLTEPGVYTLYSDGGAAPYCLCVENQDQYVFGTVNSERIFRLQSLITGKLVAFSVTSSTISQGNSTSMTIKSVCNSLFTDSTVTVKMEKKTSSLYWLSDYTNGYGYIFPLQ